MSSFAFVFFSSLKRRAKVSPAFLRGLEFFTHVRHAFDGSYCCHHCCLQILCSQTCAVRKFLKDTNVNFTEGSMDSLYPPGAEGCASCLVHTSEFKVTGLCA